MLTIYSYFKIPLLIILCLKFCNSWRSADNSALGIQLLKIINDHNLNDCVFIFHVDPEDPRDGNDETTQSIEITSSSYIDFFSVRLNSPTTLPEKFKTFADYRKRRAYCSIVVLKIDSLPSGGKNWYLTLKSIPGLIRKDEDLFIFVSSSEALLDQVLVSRPLAHATLNRLGIYQNKPSKKLVLKSSILHPKPEVFATDVTPFEVKTSLNFLNGSVLRVSTPLSTRWLNEMVQNNKGIWTAKRGLYALVLGILQEEMNFTSSQYPSTGGGTGGIRNGTWIGTVGDVIYGRAEMGHVTAETYQRFQVVAHSFPISYERLVFSTGVPKPYYTWKAIYRPLASSVWPFVGATLVIGSIFFFILMKFNLISAQEPIAINLQLIGDYVLATLVEQDAFSPEEDIHRHRIQINDSLRIFTIFWLIYTILITTAYRSKLVTFLAFPNFYEPPTTFEQLADSDYEIGLQYIRGAAYQVFKTSKNPTYVKIFNKMQLEESEVNCFKRAIGSHFSCIAWDSIAEFVKYRNLTDKYGRSPFKKSPSSTLLISAGIVTEKRAVFKKRMDYIIHWLWDTGLMDKLTHLDVQWISNQRSIWLKETNQTRGSLEDDDGTKDGAILPLSISHLSGSFYLFIIGILISVIPFFVEISNNHFEHFWNAINGKFKSRQDENIIQEQVDTTSGFGLWMDSTI